LLCERGCSSNLHQPINIIGTAFPDVGIPSSQIVRAIENIIYGDRRHLRSIDEDW
jgi:hypothetical protein